jgi:hypothetical protein
MLATLSFSRMWKGLVEIVRTVDWKYLLISVLLLSASAIAYINRAESLLMVKRFFDIEDLDLFAGGVSTIFTLTHRIKKRKLTFNGSMSFTEFRVPLEDGLSFIGNPITLVCAISLAKGVFLYSSEYFPKFTAVEIGFIGLVSAYLFFISVMELLINMKETWIMTQSKQELKAVPEGQVKSQVPPPLH